MVLPDSAEPGVSAEGRGFTPWPFSLCSAVGLRRRDGRVRLMAAVLKTAVVMSHRGFESLSLRQSLFEYEMPVFDSFQAVFKVIRIAADSRNSIGAS